MTVACGLRTWRRRTDSSADRGRGTGEDGQVLLMILGYTIIAICLVVVAVDATAVYLARTQLLDASDAAALDAADALDAHSAFAQGVDGAVPLSPAGVTQAAQRYLATYTAPDRIDGVRLAAGTGTNDGVTAVVVLSAHVRLPLLAPVVDAWSGGITVTVRSQARADVDP